MIGVASKHAYNTRHHLWRARDHAPFALLDTHVVGQVLFATCHDEEPLRDIRAAEGQYLHFKTTAAGAVTWVSPSLM